MHPIVHRSAIGITRFRRACAGGQAVSRAGNRVGNVRFRGVPASPQGWRHLRVGLARYQKSGRTCRNNFRRRPQYYRVPGQRGAVRGERRGKELRFPSGLLSSYKTAGTTSSSARRGEVRRLQCEAEGKSRGVPDSRFFLIHSSVALLPRNHTFPLTRLPLSLARARAYSLPFLEKLKKPRGNGTPPSPARNLSRFNFNRTSTTNIPQAPSPRSSIVSPVRILSTAIPIFAPFFTAIRWRAHGNSLLSAVSPPSFPSRFRRRLSCILTGVV